MFNLKYLHDRLYILDINGSRVDLDINLLTYLLALNRDELDIFWLFLYIDIYYMQDLILIFLCQFLIISLKKLLSYLQKKGVFLMFILIYHSVLNWIRRKPTWIKH